MNKTAAILTKQECLWLIRLISKDIAANKEALESIGIDHSVSRIFQLRIDNMRDLTEKLKIQGGIN